MNSIHEFVLLMEVYLIPEKIVVFLPPQAGRKLIFGYTHTHTHAHAHAHTHTHTHTQHTHTHTHTRARAK